MGESVDYCDLQCVYAEMPKEYGIDGSGSCRTFQALYCALKKSHVGKNAPCRDKLNKEEHTAE